MKELTLMTQLLKMGWQPMEAGENRDTRTFILHLFGLRVTQTIAYEILHKTGSDADRMAEIFTKRAITELSEMLYEALYNKFGRDQK